MNGAFCEVKLGYPDDRVTLEPVRYHVERTPLGAMLLATSAKGVVSILLGENATTLVTLLYERFPLADVQPGSWPEEELAQRVVHYMSNPLAGLHLPLDIRGTKFDHSVWETIRNIPAGKTITVKQLAAQLGVPLGHDAVRRACLANEIAIAIPCHRVTDSRRPPVASRWGGQRRERLRALEHPFVNPSAS
jgi:AraC family transcriptional regulator of adaptative response/methylated-DNA-[protein]-cysteine methyltransferase